MALEILEDRLLLSVGPVAGLSSLRPEMIAHAPALVAQADPPEASAALAADADAGSGPGLVELAGKAPSDGPVLSATDLGVNRYMAYEHWGGTWSDAEKSFRNADDDSLMCWGAAAANVLEWTGWGNVGGMTTADEMLDHLSDHWTNARGSEMSAWDWWFDGTNPLQGYFGAQEDVDGGGGFYRSEDFGDYYHSQVTDSRAMSAIDDYLHKGYGVALTIHGGTSHIITAWGFGYDGAGSMDYTGVWVTDSDDDRFSASPPDRLQHYAVDFRDGRWYLEDFYGHDDYYIGGVSGLARPDSETPLDVRASAKASRWREPVPNGKTDTPRRAAEAVRMLRHQRDPVSKRAPGALGSSSSDPNFGWAFSVGTSGASVGRGIAADAAGNRYVCGKMDGVAQFDPGGDEISGPHPGSEDIFVAKLNAAGDLLWAHAVGSAENEGAWDVDVDTRGNVYVAGAFRDTVDFDPGPGTASLTSAGRDDLFVMKLDAAGDFVWAHGMGSSRDDAASAIAVDGDGSVYTTGWFQGTVDFDPGPGTCSLASTGTHLPYVGRKDAFVCKLDTDGEFVWARAMGGAYVEEATDIAVDDRGNVYTTGGFYGVADFDPGPGALNLHSAGSQDVFVSKLNRWGDFVWARALGGPSFEDAYGVAVDPAGHVVLAGAFEDTADFDPDPGATAHLTSAGRYDIFVSKLDGAGDFVWARGVGGPDNDFAKDIAVDGAGNVYTTGVFSGSVDFDPGSGSARLTSAGTADLFVSKLDTSGELVWASPTRMVTDLPGGRHAWAIAVDPAGNVSTTGRFTGVADFDPSPADATLFAANASAFVWQLDTSGAHGQASGFIGSSPEQVRDCATDRSGNVYIAGSFGGTDDLDPGTGAALLSAENGSFVAKYTSSGRLVWARAFGGNGADGIAIDGSGNVYTTGIFAGTVDFDPGRGTTSLSSTADTWDVFVLKLDRSGNFVWARALGGPNSDFAGGIAADSAGNVYTTGTFWNTADFDPDGTATYSLTSAGSEDVFVSKLDRSGRFVWARAMGGTSADKGVGIAVDHRSNVYTTGMFGGTADFDPGSASVELTGAGRADVFLSKLDSSGHFVWARSMGGTRADVPHAITVDRACNVYTTGSFRGTATFGSDPGDTLTSSHTSDYFSDTFVTKHDARGRLSWARALGGSEPADITVDTAGNVYTTGAFQYSADFDPGRGTFNLTSTAGSQDIFVSKLDRRGNFVWAHTVAASSADDDPGGIAIDPLGRLYVTGGFWDTADMDPGARTSSLTAKPYSIFVTKWVDAPSVLPESVPAERDSVSPVARAWRAARARRPMSAGSGKSGLAHQKFRAPKPQLARSSHTTANQRPDKARVQRKPAIAPDVAAARMPDAFCAKDMAMDVAADRLARALLLDDLMPLNGLDTHDFRVAPMANLLRLF